MTPDQIKLNMAVMTPLGKGVVVGWTLPDNMPYLVKLENGGRHNGCAPLLIAGSTEKLNGDGSWFSCEELTAIEEPMTEQTHYADWEKLTPLPDEPRPHEKVGARFVVVNAKGHTCFELGDIVELTKNDGTHNPYFKRINENRMFYSLWQRLAPLPQPEEKKVKKITPFLQPAKKLVPFTDEFDWCEEGVLVMVERIGERYAVRAKGDQVWAVDEGKKLCDIDNNIYRLLSWDRSRCQKVIHEVHRPLTNREFAEFMQDHKGMIKHAKSMICYNVINYGCENENESVHTDLLFRFRGSEEWHAVTTELYEIAKELKA